MRYSIYVLGAFPLVCALVPVSSPTAAAQEAFEATSKPVEIDIVRTPNDPIAPSIAIDEPSENVIQGEPTFTRDSLVVLKGQVAGHLGRPVVLFVNGERCKVEKGGVFTLHMRLSLGDNTIVLEGIDRLHNSTRRALRVYRDPEVDTTPPRIETTFPGGVDVGRAVDSLRVNFRVTDETGVFRVVVGDLAIDPFIQEDFSIVFSPVPDRVSVYAIDVLGNYAVRGISLRKP